MLKPSPYKGLVLDVKHDGKSIAENEKIPTSSRITLIVGEGEQAAENDSVNETDNEEFLLGIE